jgi:hypothetical protein
MIHGYSSLIVGLCVMLAELAAPAAEEAFPVEFVMEASAARYETATPVLVRLTLRNAGSTAFQIIGEAGWGRSFNLLREDEAGRRELVPPDVPHVEDFYMPPYFFRGELPPSRSQCIIHFVPTDLMTLGRVHLKAFFFQRGRIAFTWELPVEIVGGAKNDKGRGPATLSPGEQAFIYSYVPRRHNSFWRGPKAVHARVPDHGELVSIVRKAIASGEASLACEYALYAGVLQVIRLAAQPDDIKLAEEAAEALEKRFPNSWLRAYAYGMLCTVYLERGNAEKARTLAEKGLKLPESDPLFHNLGIMEKLERLGATPMHR